MATTEAIATKHGYQTLHVTKVWDGGFTQKNALEYASKKNLKSEIKHIESLSSIVEYKISRDDGSVIIHKKILF